MRTIEEGHWGQEGGADAAANMLKRYNPTTDHWDFERAGDFWQAVRYAHELGRKGQGHTVAVIDDGFDMSFPALADQELAWSQDCTVRPCHGTVVSLLIREVAPAARLLLYPTAPRESWSEELIERALHHVMETSATVVNLSLGKAFRAERVITFEDYLLEQFRQHGWRDISDTDLPFWVAERFGELYNWRELIRSPEFSIGSAAAAVADTGRIVVAAAGNADGYAFSPAMEPGVFSVGFKSIWRRIAEGLEKAAVGYPTFSQSDFVDLSLIQPPNVLGSSFATPLISGMATLMRSKNELGAYRDMGRLSGIASDLLNRLSTGEEQQWSLRRQGVIDTLYVKAINSVPHPHVAEKEPDVCPECALFAADAFVNFGLFKLEWGDLDGAEQLLRPVERFAPHNPHASANLGITYALRARNACGNREWTKAAELLRDAALLMSKALRLRPSHEPYRTRVSEFQKASKNPRLWTMAK